MSDNSIQLNEAAIKGQLKDLVKYNGPAVKTKKEEIYREQLLI